MLDAAGNVIEGRDSKGALVLRDYDELNRPTRLWACDGTGQLLTLRERLLYGDNPDLGLSPTQVAEANLLGRLYQHFDEAGLLTFEAYDFKGNLLEKARRVISDTAILSVFNSPPPDWQINAFRVDWNSATETLLEPPSAAYVTSTTHDALNRVKTIHYPRDVDGERKVSRLHFNRAGALESVTLDGATYAERIAYNAKGQRTLIAYGNGVMTRYAYDAQTFRLARMCTERYTMPNEITYRREGVPLQDFAYEYDPVGNITLISDRTPNGGIPNSLLGTNALDRAFTYDPLYRLRSATGRECDQPSPNPPWNDVPKCHDDTLTRAYRESYAYDPVGNMTHLGHQAGDGGFNRNFALVPNTNRLAVMMVGATEFDYTHDANGNLLGETTSRHFEWDHGNRLRIYRTQPNGAEPSVHAHYLYDTSGQRVKKLVRKQGGQFEVTVCVDGILEHHRLVQGGTTQETNTLHVIDNQSRIAMVRAGNPFADDTTPAVKFHVGDHLGNSSVVISDNGDWINREEYTPYGETSFGSFARKRYRFTGRERDEESGLSYHGARYYPPWLARWLSCDPVGIAGGLNPYRYASGRPIGRVDPSGMQDEPIETPAESPPQVSGYDANAVDPTYSNYYHSPEQSTASSPPEVSPLLNDVGGEPILDGPHVIEETCEEPPTPPEQPPGGGGYGGDSAIKAGEVAKHGAAGFSFGAAAAAAGRLVGGGVIFVLTLPLTLGSDQPSPEVEKSPQQKANEAAFIVGTVAGGAAVEGGVPRRAAGAGAGGPSSGTAARTGLLGRIQSAIRSFRKQNVEEDIWSDMGDIYAKQGPGKMLEEVQHVARTDAGRRSLQEMETQLGQIKPRNEEEFRFLVSLRIAIRRTLNP